MYTVLVGLTCFVMFILAIGVFTPYDTISLFITIPDMIKANRSSITEQYDVSKDGNIIQFERKTNNRTLEKKVAVKVIGESKDAYQTEYHGDYYQISKTDVKKGNN